MKIIITLSEGDIGNMYGFQLNHAGAESDDCNTDYSDKGFNQIEYCLNLLKNDKFSRRIIIVHLYHEAQRNCTLVMVLLYNFMLEKLIILIYCHVICIKGQLICS